MGMRRLLEPQRSIPKASAEETSLCTDSDTCLTEPGVDGRQHDAHRMADGGWRMADGACRTAYGTFDSSIHCAPSTSWGRGEVGAVPEPDSRSGAPPPPRERRASTHDLGTSPPPRESTTIRHQPVVTAVARSSSLMDPSFVNVSIARDR